MVLNKPFSLYFHAATHGYGSQRSQDAASRSRHNTLVPETTVDLDQFCAECGAILTTLHTLEDSNDTWWQQVSSSALWEVLDSFKFNGYGSVHRPIRARPCEKIRPCILPHTRMSHLQLAPGAASWWEMAGERAMDNGRKRLVEPTMTPAPGLRGERRWKSPVYTLPGLHESEYPPTRQRSPSPGPP